MSITLTVRDETTSGGILNEFVLELLTEHITVRELIRSRVYQEVHDYNRLQPQVYRGLIEPTDAEKTLNGYELRTARTIDWKKQYDKAIAAFEGNGIVILVGDKQVESLEEEIVVRPGDTSELYALDNAGGGMICQSKRLIRSPDSHHSNQAARLIDDFERTWHAGRGCLPGFDRDPLRSSVLSLAALRGS